MTTPTHKTRRDFLIHLTGLGAVLAAPRGALGSGPPAQATLPPKIDELLRDCSLGGGGVEHPMSAHNIDGLTRRVFTHASQASSNQLEK